MTAIRGLEPVVSIDFGVAYRFGYYDRGSKSHLVNRYESDVSYCGRLVWPEGDTLDSAGIENWLVYPEQRKKPSVCGECKKGESKFRSAEAARAYRPQAFYEITAHPDELLREALRMIPGKVVVSGSRSITDEKYIADCLRIAWEEMGPFIKIIHGGASGVDRIAGEVVGDTVAQEVYPAAWDEEGEAAGILRNARMLDTAPDYVIVIWDGWSTTTDHMFDLTKTRQIPYICFTPSGRSLNRTGRNEYVTQDH